MRIEDKTIQAIMNMLKTILGNMPADDRVKFWDSLQDGYCIHCGWKLSFSGGYCQCINDE